MTGHDTHSHFGFDFRWVEVSPGRLALWHRPGRRAIPHLKTAGCDHVVTLLSAREGAEEVGELIRRAAMAWTWIPLAGGRPPQGRQNGPIVAGLPFLSSELDAGRSILIHCSAGMHRTGMIAYALLRYRGLDEGQALEVIEKMRSHTRQALGREHVEWGNGLMAAVRPNVRNQS